METTASTDVRYQKLASEYGKLRTQASVLRKGVLDEQAKGAKLKDKLRESETSLRRSEQEIEALVFRNKQLEHRVGALQDEIGIQEGRKRDKAQKRNGKSDSSQAVDSCDNYNVPHDLEILEELQKKIMENAELALLVDDQQRELKLREERIAFFEKNVEIQSIKHSELETRLRREIEILQHRNVELENKLVDVASMLGSEDALSVSGSDSTLLHNHTQLTVTASEVIIASHIQHSNEERIINLEKEVSHWRSQFEIAKLNAFFCSCGNYNKENENETCLTTLTNQQIDVSCSCSSAAAGITIKPSYAESRSKRDSIKEVTAPPSKEQLIYNKFCLKFEDLLKAKCMAESRVTAYQTEADHLENCLENAMQELKVKDEHVQSINRAVQILEEDLASTRINYEEQISVLTEQVINLSDKLAECK